VRLWLTGFILSLLILAGLNSRLSGVRRFGSFNTDPPSPYLHYLPQGKELGQILVVHGLDANKEIMNLLCLALSDAGFNVYSMDMPGHGDSKVGFNAILARQAVAAALDNLGPNTIVIGHSLGGALLLDLGNERPFGTMVLLSPAPTPVDQIRTERLLVLTGQFDLPKIQEFVPQLRTANSRIDLRTIPWSGHGGYIFQPEPIREIVIWLGGDPSTLHTWRRILLLLLEIVCAVSIAVLSLQGKPVAPEQTFIPARIATYIACCTLAYLISGVVIVLNGLRLFSTDYLISFVLLMGITLSPACFRKFPRTFSQIPVSLFAAACVLAAAVFVGSELIHLMLSGGRWWRFAAITVAVLPLSFADEVLLRPIRPWWKAAGVVALTRILMAAFIVTGVLTLNRGSAFLVLIIHFVVLFWIALWFAGELFRRRTQDALATAVFTALVQAWLFAAMFVLT
jgi:hypothetical protein